jgi:hypothetical protein
MSPGIGSFGEAMNQQYEGPASGLENGELDAVSGYFASIDHSNFLAFTKGLRC